MGTIMDVGYDIPQISSYLDWINVMTYDYHGQWDKKTGHVAPMYEHPDDEFYFLDNHSPSQNHQKMVSMLLLRLVAKQELQQEPKASWLTMRFADLLSKDTLLFMMRRIHQEWDLMPPRETNGLVLTTKI